MRVGPFCSHYIIVRPEKWEQKGESKNVRAKSLYGKNIIFKTK